MSLSHPLKKVYITQKWGVNGDIYKRFGYKGHNGQDYRLHSGNGTPVYSPHSGVVKERRTDENGYGRYLKIENDREGSILAHLKDWNVNINKKVEEGDLIGWGDNTGWSTGSHLHWSYYRHPRDRQNGFGGTIDQTPYIGEPMSEDIRLKLLNENGIKTESDVRNAIERYKKWEGLEKDKRNADAEITRLRDEYNKAKDDLKTERDANIIRVNAEKEFRILDIKSIAEAAGSTQDVPSILQAVSILRSAEDLKGKADAIAKKAKDDLALEKEKHAVTSSKLMERVRELDDSLKELKALKRETEKLRKLLKNTSMAKMRISPAMGLIKEDLLKIGKGALLSALTAVALYAADSLQTIDLGENWWAPVAVALIPVIANALRKWGGETKYK